jgi:succinoglycan biosynthesis transport protein ExoP
VSELDQGLDLRFYLGVLRRRLLVMLLAFVVLAGAAFAVAVLLPPVFQSQAKIIVESQQIPPDLVRSTVTGLADERVQVIQQRITTREVLLGLVEKLQLFADERQRLTPTELVDLMRNSIAIERFDLGDRRGRRDALTIGFTVGFEHRNPQMASRVANELMTLILAEDVKSRTSRASETTRFIEREADRRRKELAGIEAQISAFKLENDSVLPEKLPSLMSRLERANSELATFDREIYGSQEQERLLELELSVRKANGTRPAGTTRPKSAALRQLDALNAELAAKQSLYSDTHPDIQSLRRQIAALEGQEASLASSSTGDGEPPASDLTQLDVDTMLLSEKIDTLQRRRVRFRKQHENVSRVVEDLNELISKVPEVQVYLVSLERQHEAVRTNLAELNSKLNEARLGQRLEQDKQAERFEVIEQPTTPTDPIKPNRPMILAGGLGLAAGAALGIALLLEMLNRTVRSAADVTRILGQPPLATIPYIATAVELRRNRARLIFGLLLALAVLAAALLTIHFAYMPLDETVFKVLRRFGL